MHLSTKRDDPFYLHNLQTNLYTFAPHARSTTITFGRTSRNQFINLSLNNSHQYYIDTNFPEASEK